MQIYLQPQHFTVIIIFSCAKNKNYRLLRFQIFDVDKELGLVLHPAHVRKIRPNFVELEFPGLDFVDVKVEVLESRNELLAEPVGVGIDGEIGKLLDRRKMVGSDESTLADVAHDDVEGLGLGLLVLQLVVVGRIVDRKHFANVPGKVHEHLIVLLEGNDPVTKIFQFLLNGIGFGALRHVSSTKFFEKTLMNKMSSNLPLFSKGCQ